MVTRGRTDGGFTLLELLLVILITGILAVVVAPVINEPVRAYFDQTTRADLVDSAEMALRRIARDVRRSLPYSVRVNGAQTAVEMIGVLDVARYREAGGGGVNPVRRLRFNNTDDSFNVLGTFTRYGAGTLAGNERLVIFNLGSPVFDAYENDGEAATVMTPSTTTVAITNDPTPPNGAEHQVTMTPAFQFTASSPSHRVYIANGGTSYACSGGALFRLSNYGYLETQRTPAQVAAGDLLTDSVTSCRFDYDAGDANRPGLLIMTVTLTRDGESVTLLHEVHVPNAT